MLSTIGYAVCQASLFVIPRAMFIAAVPGMLGCGFIAAGFTLLGAGHDRRRGRRGAPRAGQGAMSLLYSLVTTTTKVGGAITVPVTYGVLAYVGLQARGERREHALRDPRADDLLHLRPDRVCSGRRSGHARLQSSDAKRHAEVRAKLDLRDAAAGGALLIDAMAHAKVLEVAAAPRGP